MNDPLFPEHARTSDGLNYLTGTVDVQGGPEPSVGGILAVTEATSAYLKRAEFQTAADLGLATIAYVDAEIAGIDLTSLVAIAPATTARNTVQPTDAAVVPLSIKGAASQSAHYQDWENSSGTVQAYVAPPGTDTATIFSTSALGRALWGNATGATAIGVYGENTAASASATGVTGSAGTGIGTKGLGGTYGVMGQSDSGYSGFFLNYALNGTGNSQPTLVTRAKASQTSNLFEVQNTSATAIAGFTVAGNLFAANFGGAVPALGTANQILGVNAGATATEYKTVTAGTNISVVHGVGTVTINNTATGYAPNYAAVWHLGAATFYSTLAAAVSAAVSGDTIEVFAGTFNEVNLLKNGVNWFFHAGAVVAATSGGTAAMFDDGPNGANGAVTCTIGGYGQFSVSITSRKLMNIQNGSTINMICESLATSASAGALLDQTGTSSTVRIRTNQLNPQSTATNAVNCAGSTAYQEVDCISLNANNGGAITLASTANNCYQVVRALYANNLRDISCSNGSQHVELGGLEGLSNCDIINTTGRQMIHVHGVRTNTGFNSITQGGAGGIQHFYAKEVRLGGASGFGAAGSIECTTGSQYIRADSITGTTSTADLVSCSGGTQVVDARLVTLAQSSRYAIECTGGTQRLVNVRAVNTNSTGVAANYAGGTMITEGSCTFVSGGSATDSITAPSAQNLKNYGVIVGNKALNANVTLQVNTVSSYFSDANVV